MKSFKMSRVTGFVDTAEYVDIVFLDFTKASIRFRSKDYSALTGILWNYW